MDDDELKEMIEQAVEAGVVRAFARVGVDIGDDWHNVQHDMSFLRQLRTGTQKVRVALFTSITLTLVTGMLFLVWEAIKNN